MKHFPEILSRSSMVDFMREMTKEICDIKERSPKEISSYQIHRPSVDESLSREIEPNYLSTLNINKLDEYMVCRIVSNTRMLLTPIKSSSKKNVHRVLLSEHGVNQLKRIKEIDRSCIVIGSILKCGIVERNEDIIDKDDPCPLLFSHWVVNVESIWTIPIVPTRYTYNLLELKLECEPSSKGRIRREMYGKDEYLVLECKYGIEVCVREERLSPFLSRDLTIDNTMLICDSILMDGYQQCPFKVLDRCRIIKKTGGMEDEIILSRTSYSQRERTDRRDVGNTLNDSQLSID